MTLLGSNHTTIPDTFRLWAIHPIRRTNAGTYQSILCRANERCPFASVALGIRSSRLSMSLQHLINLRQYYVILSDRGPFRVVHRVCDAGDRVAFEVVGAEAVD